MQSTALSKPRVERSFWELERSFFNGRKFRDEADLQAQLRWWMANVCDTRPQRRSGRRTPLERRDLEPLRQEQLMQRRSDHGDMAGSRPRARAPREMSGNEPLYGGGAD